MKRKCPFEYSSEDKLTFPIPIRDNSLIVVITDLPRDLTHSEAERICQIIMTLAVKP